MRKEEPMPYQAVRRRNEKFKARKLTENEWHYNNGDSWCVLAGWWEVIDAMGVSVYFAPEVFRKEWITEDAGDSHEA
jgi:hypothetical protein